MNFAFGIENMNKPSESITKKINDSNTTLEDLLKEEELLQEFKSQNKDLINFFNKDKIKEMLNYITKEQADEQEKGYKFPFLCSQIFGLEIEDLMKYFFITNKEMEELEKNKENNKENKEKENNDNIEQNKNENEEKKEEATNEEKPEEKKDEVKSEEKKEEVKFEENAEEKAEAKKEEIKPEEKTEEKPEKKPEEKPEEKSEEKPEEKPEEKQEEKTTEEKAEENNEENKENNEENEENNEEDKSEPESKENKIEVLDYLFENFFPEDESIKLNYVLSGYFSSLINNLLSMKPLEFLKYIYLERSEYLNKMVDHFYSKIIFKIMSHWTKKPWKI